MCVWRGVDLSQPRPCEQEHDMDRIVFKPKTGLCFQTPHVVCARIALCVWSPRGDAENRFSKLVDKGSELKSESRRVWVKGWEVRVVLEGKGLGVSEREKLRKLGRI